MPESPEEIGRLLYLLLLLAGIGGAMLFGRRRGGGRALRDFTIWGLIFAMVVIAYGFRDVLTRELWPQRAMVTETGAIALRRGRDGHFHATVEVNGAPVRFLVDTGATGILLSQRDAEAAGLDVASLDFDAQAATANGMVPIAPVRLGDLRFGEIEVRDMAAAVNGGALDTSLLGMSFLDRFDSIEIRGDTLLLNGPVRAQGTR